MPPTAGSARSTTTGEIGFGEHAEASPWKMKPSMKGSNGDVGAWRSEVGLCACNRELKFVIEHQRAKSLSRPSSIGRDDDSLTGTQ